MIYEELKYKISNVIPSQFDELALEVFLFQSSEVQIYKKYLNLLGIQPSKIKKIEEIPFLPIEFFKNHRIVSNTFNPAKIFESSSTTGKNTSKHYLKSEDWYCQSFIQSFNELNKVKWNEYCHLALLPSYIERGNSSLIYQINYFIENSQIKHSNFYSTDYLSLYNQLIYNESNKIPTLLWGVSFALLDFADQFSLKLNHTNIIETGGMKGRRKEITRKELHELLKQSFSLEFISSEYGMTELMSQCYATRDGLYSTPNSMKVFPREINDPLSSSQFMKNAALNIIDLNNIDSCCFIASSDLAYVYSQRQFEIIGRLDFSDVRGCNLLI